MLTIAICDDENIILNRIKEILSHYMADHGMLFGIDTFCSGKEFASLGIEMKKYQIVFLDINMDEFDGLMTARTIRENSRDMFIVFITAFVNYTLEGYKVDAVRYILKDDKMESGIYECMDAIREKMDYRIAWKEFAFTEGDRKIPLDRLLYIESSLHKLIFYVMEDSLITYTMHGTLNSMEEKLAGNNFLRIHQSYLVNMRFIKTIRRYYAVLNNGLQFDIPRARYKEAAEKFVAYRGGI